MATVYPGGTGITIVTNTNLEADDMTFMGTSIAGSPQQTDYSDVKAGIVGNPGALGGVTPATALSVAGTVGLDGAVTINETGADVNMRVEGDTDANLLFVDAGNDYVGIGTNAPSDKLHVVGGIESEYIYFQNGEGIYNATDGRLDLASQDTMFTPNYANGGLKVSSLSTNFDITASASVQFPLPIPTGCQIIGCQIRVDTALTGGELWDAEWNDGSTLQAIATAQAVAQNTKVNKFFDSFAATPLTDANTYLTIKKNGGGSFTAQGNLFACVFFMAFEALASV